MLFIGSVNQHMLAYDDVKVAERHHFMMVCQIHLPEGQHGDIRVQLGCDCISMKAIAFLRIQLLHKSSHGTNTLVRDLD